MQARKLSTEAGSAPRPALTMLSEEEQMLCESVSKFAKEKIDPLVTADFTVLFEGEFHHCVASRAGHGDGREVENEPGSAQEPVLRRPHGH